MGTIIPAMNKSTEKAISILRTEHFQEMEWVAPKAITAMYREDYFLDVFNTVA